MEGRLRMEELIEDITWDTELSRELSPVSPPSLSLAVCTPPSPLLGCFPPRYLFPYVHDNLRDFEVIGPVDPGEMRVGHAPLVRAAFHLPLNTLGYVFEGWDFSVGPILETSWADQLRFFADAGQVQEW
jgi:hypothetical protein